MTASDDISARWRAYYERAPIERDDDRCLKCGSLPEERCANAEREGGTCSRKAAL